MSHNAAHIIIDSMFEVFDGSPKYAGVREHFSTSDLAEIDRIRALPDTHHFTLQEKIFCSYACGKAILTGD